MPYLTKTFLFATPASFTYGSSVTISNGTVKLTNATGTYYFSETFATSSGFTYDSTKILFDGSLKQKSGILGLSYNSTINPDWSSDTFVTASEVSGGAGGAFITDGKLDLTDSSIKKRVYYTNSDAMTELSDKGTIKFKYVPDYSTKPNANTDLFSIGSYTSDSGNYIYLRHASSTGNLSINVVKNSVVYSDSFLFQPTSGNLYEIKASWDLVYLNRIDLFIDGTKEAFENLIPTGSLGTINSIMIGGSVRKTISGDNGYSDAYFEDVILYDNYQGSTYSTITYSVDSISKYTEATASASYTSNDAVLSYNSFSVTTTTNSPKFVLDGRYWNGTIWKTSDGSYASASSESDINTNIGSLGTPISLKIKTVFQASSSTQGEVDTMSIGYTKIAGYATNNPTFDPVTAITTSSLASLSSTFTTSGTTDTIKFTLDVDGTEKYVTGGVWTTSSGYSQSNTLSEINAYISTLLSESSNIKPVLYLHSNDISESPILTDLSIRYNYATTGQQTLPSECVIYGNLIKSDGSAMESATVKAKANDWELLQKNFIVSNSVLSTTTDSAGYFELSLVKNVERQGGSPVRFDFTITPSGSSSSYTIYYKTIPDQATVQFKDL